MGWTVLQTPHCMLSVSAIPLTAQPYSPHKPTSPPFPPCNTAERSCSPRPRDILTSCCISVAIAWPLGPPGRLHACLHRQRFQSCSVKMSDPSSLYPLDCSGSVSRSAGPLQGAVLILPILLTLIFTLWQTISGGNVHLG